MLMNLMSGDHVPAIDADIIDWREATINGGPRFWAIRNYRGHLFVTVGDGPELAKAIMQAILEVIDSSKK